MASRHVRPATTVLALLLVALAVVVALRHGPSQGDPEAVERSESDDAAEREARLRGRADCKDQEPTEETADAVATDTCTVHVAAYDEAYDPLPGAAVRVVLADGSERTVTTDEQGAARLEEVPAGTVRAVATKPGYTTSDVETAFAASWRETWLSLGVERSGVLRGTVVDDRDGRAVAGARATALEVEGVGMNPGPPPRLGRPFGHGRTDDPGTFHIDGVPLTQPFGVTLLRVEAARYRTVWHLAPAPGKDADVVVRLVPGGRATGRVLDAAGRPVVGATVYAALEGGRNTDPTWAPYQVALPGFHQGVLRSGGAHPECVPCDAWPTLETRSGAGGRFRFEGLGLGERYVLAATATGHAPSKPCPGVQVREAPREADVTLRLQPACTLTVRCTDAQGRPYPELEVSIHHAWGYGPALHTVRSDGAGVARLEDLRAGTHEVRIHDDRLGHTVHEEIETTPGENELAVRSPRRLDDPRPPPRIVPNAERPTPAREHPPTLVGRVAIAPGAEPPTYVGLTGRWGGGSAWGGRDWKPDADGTLPFRWTWDPLRFTFLVEAAGFVPIVCEVDRTERPLVDLGTLVLAPGETLVGRVLAPDGEPLSDVHVAAKFEVAGRDFTRDARTDGSGRFRLDGLPRGPVEVRLEDARFLATTVEVVLPREDGPVRLVPPTGAWIVLTAVDADEHPVPRCPVSVHRVRGKELELEAYGETDVAGRFRVRVPPGAYRLEVAADAYRREGEVETLELEVADGESRDVRVLVERP